MATIWSGWYWHLGLASLLAVGGAIAALSDCVLAQVTPDSTLGAESSVVTPTAPGSPSDVIDGGATRGANLFHSFDEFSVPTGGEAFFNNALDIQNIISRVTGGSISNIDGLIRANGTANLFLLNPNGIVFGPNASLNIGGSFMGSTASSLNFADGTQFSATAPQATPLLTVSVPMGLQYGGSAGSILNQSRATNSSGGLVGLQVQPGNTLMLMGGDVRLDGGILYAPGGRVELGGVSGAGTVGLNVDGSNLSLSYPASVQRADVSLTNGARIYVAASDGGSIAVNARSLDVLGGTELTAGIRSGQGSVGSQAGDIEIDATGAVTVAGSTIFNTVESGSVGKGGDINILAESLSLDNALLGAFTSGQGDAGSISVRASDSVSATNNSGFLSSVSSGAVGKGGNIDIQARSLSLTDGAQMFASTFGQGDAGTISVQVDDSVSLADNSLISNSVVSEAVGKGGNIDIQARSLSLTNTARLNTSTFGQGNAGSVFVRANDSVSLANSSIFSNVFSKAVGTGGEINIQAGSLSLTDNATLSTNTYGQGDAGSVSVRASDSVSVANSFISSGVGNEAVGKGGNINIQTRSLSLTDSTQLSANTYGQGDAGSVFVAADDSVSVTTNSLITSAVGWQAVGKAGNIDIQARSLSLTDDAVLSTSTSGQGDAGSVSVQTNDSVSVTSDSAIASSVLPGGVGNGGLIDINAGSLSLSDGALIITDVRGASEERAGGRGNAGSVNIDVRNTVTIAGRNDEESLTGIFSDVEAGAVGNGGLIGINAELLSLSDGAQVNVSSLGSGNAGNLEVRAGSIRLDNQSRLRANTIAGQGNIFLRSRDLVLRRGSNISTNAGGTASGGNINIDSDVIAALSNSDISANSANSLGGRVTINAQGIFGTEFREEDTSQSDITASSDLGPEFSGTVEINNPDVDPTQGLVELPAELVDASSQIAQGCPDAVWRGESKFIITGRGGLPPSPTEPLRGDNTLTNWSTLEEPEVENRSSDAPSTNSTKDSAPTTIVEANGWVKGPNGEVTLIATAPTANIDIPWLPESSCNALGQSM